MYSPSMEVKKKVTIVCQTTGFEAGPNLPIVNESVNCAIRSGVPNGLYCVPQKCNLFKL